MLRLLTSSITQALHHREQVQTSQHSLWQVTRAWTAPPWNTSSRAYPSRHSSSTAITRMNVIAAATVIAISIRKLETSKWNGWLAICWQQGQELWLQCAVPFLFRKRVNL